MEGVAQLLLQHGYLILFAWVLLDQLGLPFPAEPMILAAGAMAGSGHLDLSMCVAIVVLACLPANFLWYWLGVHQGNKVLTFLCLIELETDACVNRTTSAFHRYGTVSLLFAKFVPGLQSIASPMAGLLGVRMSRFLALSGSGTLLYALALLIPAYVAHDYVVRLGAAFAEFGGIALTMIVVLFAGWLGWKIWHRQAYIRALRGRRIDPQALHQKLQDNEPVQVADLRQRMEFNRDPFTIPGAVRVPLDIFDERVEQLARDRLLVLFCT